MRANAIGPGGATRMAGGVLKDVEIKEPDAYGDDEFSRLNPQNSAPMVAWLASDEAMHVTGQVFRAVGTNIAHYEPWKLGASVDNPKGEVKWDPAAIGAEVNAQVFHSRHPGLKMGGGSTRSGLRPAPTCRTIDSEHEQETHGRTAGWRSSAPRRPTVDGSTTRRPSS